MESDVEAILVEASNAEPERLSDLTHRCERLAEQFPDDPHVHVVLGGLFLKQEEYEKAESSLGRAVGLAPGDAAARIKHSLALSRTVGLPSAVAEMFEAARLEPDDPNTRFLLGQMLRASRRSGDAVTELSAAVALYRPDVAFARIALGCALHECGKTSLAIREWRRAQRLDPRGEMGREARELLNRFTTGSK